MFMIKNMLRLKQSIDAFFSIFWCETFFQTYNVTCGLLERNIFFVFPFLLPCTWDWWEGGGTYRDNHQSLNSSANN